MRRRFRSWVLFVQGAGAVFCLALLAVAGSPSGSAAAAGFAEGLEAYDAGDLPAAYAAWLPLAEAGDPQAQVALAGLLEGGGPGLARDIAAAAGWYRRAALAGDPIAQMNLADLHARGVGVERDPVRALAWFTLAAEQGQGWAAAQRQRLAKSLSSAERQAAARLAAALRAGD